MRTLLKLIFASIALTTVFATRIEDKAWELAQTSADLIDTALIGPVTRDSFAQKRSGSSSSSRSTTRTSTGTSNEDKYGIGAFVAGCIMIPFSLVLLWKNEKKQVTYAKLVAVAKEECTTVEADSPDEANNYNLVHVTGTTENAEDITDHSFGCSVANSYRLVRTVEMYQWKETKTTTKNGDEETTVTEYDQGWFEYPISSSNFDDQDGHENPSNEWPFKSETIDAQTVTMGKFRLNSTQVKTLGGQRDESLEFENDGEDVINTTADALAAKEFANFELRDGYLYSSTSANDESQHIGQYRVKFHYNQCGTATVMAQQIQDNEDGFTFRKWNPEKRNVEYGQSTDAEMDSTWGSPLCCYICLCVNCCMGALFEEVVDVARDGQLSSSVYFEEQDNMVDNMKYIRPLGIFLCIFGHYLLFSPIIKLLDMIPFVGWLLSGLVAVAAIIFAIVVGLTLSVLTIAIAWVFFRPLIGIPLLLIVAASIYLTFYYDWNAHFGNEVGENTTSSLTEPASTGGTT